MDQSPEVRRARLELQALAGRRVTAGVWLPRLPGVSFQADQRTFFGGAPGSTFNWYVTLSQEVEIGGQRGARLREVDATLDAEIRRYAVVRLDVSAQALAAYFDVVAANDFVQLAREVGRVADGLGALAQARAQESLVSPVDADVAKSEAVQISQIRYEAERRQSSAQTLLAGLLGLDPAEPISVTGELSPQQTTPTAIEAGLAGLETTALMLRGEIAAAQAERRVLESRLDLIRRLQIPNPTVSFFAQRDGFSERVIGGGISIPIPLLSPIWPSRAGEIQETIARIEQASANVALVRRQVRIQVAQAYADWRSRRAALQQYFPDLMVRAKRDLGAIGEGLSSRQLTVRDALLAQRSLIQLELGHVEARRAYAAAWVNLMRMSGFDLAEGRP
ncbi:TolC family protein [Candidatus Binatus sp.]|uniref:TolC family protein n=1 Tax=Candidatus Binatus sp. TaxID=2811406 RepID=UPI00351D883E